MNIDYITAHITAQVASMPHREKALHRCLKSIYKQVDKIRVMLDGYAAVPDWAHEINNAEFHLIAGNVHEDGLKFMGCEKNGLTLIIDDDIEYPDNFVEVMFQKWRDSNYRSVFPPTVVTVMGKNMRPRPIDNYYMDEAECFHTFGTNDRDAQVLIPGTCGMLFHSSVLRVSLSDMVVPNADLCVAKLAKEQGVRCIVIAHDSSWLTDLGPLIGTNNPNIFDRNKSPERMARLVEFINAYL